MFDLPPFVIIIVVGIVGSYLASAISESLVAKDHATLDPDTRERYSQQLLKYDLAWRILNGLGIAAMIIGILRMLRIIATSMDARYGVYCLVAGIVILCLERILRCWSRAWTFSTEAKGHPIVGKAFTAAALITVIEVGIAGGIGYYIVSKVKPRTPTQKSNASKKNSPKTTAKKNSQYISADEALKILGKEGDQAYLDLFVQFFPVQMATLNGEFLYRKTDLSRHAENFLPTKEELLKRKAQSTQPVQEKPIKKQNQAPEGDVLTE